MYILYCPHCRRVTETTNHPVSYGSPLRTCAHCGKAYIDPNCTEPALRDYVPCPSRPQLLRSLTGGITCSGLIAIVTALISQNDRLGLLIWAVGSPILFLTIFCCLRLTQRKREPRRLRVWVESDQRLRDPEYASILANYGYRVPSRYLPSGSRTAAFCPGATVETSTSGKLQNPPPHMPDGSDFY